MPKPASCSSTNESLSLSYKIPTDQLICSVDGSTEGEWTYTGELNVDEQTDYPDIAASTWTITLKIDDKDGKAHASVRPKKEPTGLKSPSGNSARIDCRVRHDEGARWSDVRTGKSGYAAAVDHNDLDGLVASYAPTGRKRHYRLRRGTIMQVILTFYVEKKDVRMDLIEHLKVLYERDVLTDGTLKCGDTKFPVHRAILAVQSSVFEDKFQNETVDKSYPIEDIGQTALGQMIRFAYTRDPIEGGLDALEGLWIAADKYEMSALTDECECKMVEAINADTAFQCLLFARDYKLEMLQTAAAKFIAGHPKAVQ